MAEYKRTILRNALLAAIGIILIVGVAIFGSTVITQVPNLSEGGHSTSQAQSTSLTNVSVNSSSNSSSSSHSSTSKNESSPSTTYSTTTSSTSGYSSSLTSTSSSSPSTLYPPAGTIAEIPFSATAFAYDSLAGVVYAISNQSVNEILEVNGTTNKVIGVISLGSGTFATSIQYDQVNNELYIALSKNGTVGITSSVIAINPVSNAVLMNLTGLDVKELAVDPAHNLVYASMISNSNDTTDLGVVIINGTTNEEVGNYTLFSTPNSFGENGCCYLGHMIYDPVSGYLYESSGFFGTDGGFSPFLVIYDTHTNTRFEGSNLTSIPSYGTTDFAFNPLNGLMYLSNNGYVSSLGAYNLPYVSPGDNITILNGTHYINSIKIENANVNGTLGSIVFDPTNQRLFVASGKINFRTAAVVYNDVTIVDSQTGVISDVIQVQSGGINSIFYDQSSGDLYVASSTRIYVISLS